MNIKIFTSHQDATNTLVEKYDLKSPDSSDNVRYP